MSETDSASLATAARVEGDRVGVITFMLGRELLGAELGSVREIINVNPDRITGLFRVEPFLKGLINIRGTIHPVVGLESVLGIADAGSGTTRRKEDGTVSAVNFSVDGTGVICMVDRIEAVRWIEHEEMNELITSEDSRFKEYISYTLRTGAQPIQVLNVRSVFDAKLWKAYQEAEK